VLYIVGRHNTALLATALAGKLMYWAPSRLSVRQSHFCLRVVSTATWRILTKLLQCLSIDIVSDKFNHQLANLASDWSSLSSR
jgi:hypothetical protein